MFLRYSLITFCLFALTLSIFSSSCTSSNNKVLTIATAANMQFAMEELVDIFQEENNIQCELITGSSGKLTAQILESAPYDLFVSADTFYPFELSQKGNTLSEPINYAIGQLVLWSWKKRANLTLESLLNDDIHHIAIANPKTAPYGLAAQQTLYALNLYDTLQQKLVYGESISQTNQFITSQAAEIGFTAKSTVFSPQMKGKGTWISIDTSLYEKIIQALVPLKNQRGLEKEIYQFIEFIKSTKGRATLEKYGYLLPEN